MLKKRIVLIIILLISLSIILSGCNSEQTFHSTTDSAYTTKFNNFLIMFRTDSIRLTQEVESNLVKELNNKNVKAISSNKAIPLTRSYSENEMSKALHNVIEEHNIDGILFISTKNFNIESEQYNHTPNPDPQGNLASFMEGFNSARDGQISHTLNFDVEVNLFNAKKDGIAWRAESHFSDSNYSGEDDIINLFKNSSEFLVKQLEDDGLI
jgi:hypothetical protein